MLISYDDQSLLDNVDIKNYPNEIVDKNYKTFKRLLKYYNIKYHKLYLHHKGGIYFIFKKNNVEVFVEIFNDKILNCNQDYNVKSEVLLSIKTKADEQSKIMAFHQQLKN